MADTFFQGRRDGRISYGAFFNIYAYLQLIVCYVRILHLLREEVRRRRILSPQGGCRDSLTDKSTPSAVRSG